MGVDPVAARRTQELEAQRFDESHKVHELDVGEIGPAPKLRRQRETFTSVPAERLIERHRLYHDEFRAMTLTERERVLEGTTRGLREVDRYENARELLHDVASRLGNGYRPHYLPLRGKNSSIYGAEVFACNSCGFS